MSGKSEHSLSAGQREQRAKYLQCMHAGYNEWLLSVSLGQVRPWLRKFRPKVFFDHSPRYVTTFFPQVLPAGSMLDHEVFFRRNRFSCFVALRACSCCSSARVQVAAVQQLLLHYVIESPPLATISHSKNEGSSKANQSKHNSKPAKQQRKSDL